MSEAEPRMASRPPRFLADENLEGDIVRGALRKRPSMMFLTAREAGTLHLDDPDVLRRAQDLDLILITHDRKTMPTHLAELLMGLQEGEHCPGVFIVSQEGYSIGETIECILEIYDLSAHDEWRDQIRNLPL